jgi:hypothetical protein
MTMSTTKSPHVIQLSERHKSSGQLGRSGWRIGTAYAARKTTAATISGHLFPTAHQYFSFSGCRRHTCTRLVERLSRSDITIC